jgi:hypothetical protein
MALLQGPGAAKARRVTEVMFSMSKIDIPTLKKAGAG